MSKKKKQKIGVTFFLLELREKGANLASRMGWSEKRNLISLHPDDLHLDSQILTHLHDFKMVISSLDAVEIKKFSKI